ncbi:hypothetical protein HCN44_005150 [Aphidius gifuensis]|uniref:NADH dehydrogenase [ubiquinone] 1 alpha subcomplex subunit 12 n=1 Tax=Aphidius gifuensis TaxID=684658 RepID=A0A834XXV0_APHGI|nr:probable NADH dehydrogenase [ubiquinone] 1 alpha subcomplex subunit 12 [Aphidius gifuensis]KAF7992806.1 hypothetical protein HCN44_005150 [Aphidius gifuensis]
MQRYVDMVVNLAKIFKQNKGPLGMLRTMYRTDDLKWGTLVGEDKYGNKYYENNYFFYGRNRWIIYNERVHMDYDASQVPAEWYGWLHYKTDLLPHNDPNRPKYKWMIDHQQNLSGTKNAYMPYSTTKPKVEAWKPS